MKTMNKAAIAGFAIWAGLLVNGSGTVGAHSGNPKSDFASANHIKSHDEIHGTGRFLILLHDALTRVDDAFGEHLPFEKARQIVAMQIALRYPSLAHKLSFSDSSSDPRSRN